MYQYQNGEQLGAAVARGGGGRGFAFGFPGAFNFNGFRSGNPFLLNFPFQTFWPNTWYPYYPLAYAGATCPIGTINLTAAQTRVLQAGQALVIVALDTCGNQVQVTLHGTPGAGLTVQTALAGVGGYGQPACDAGGIGQWRGSPPPGTPTSSLPMPYHLVPTKSPCTPGYRASDGSEIPKAAGSPPLPPGYHYCLPLGRGQRLVGPPATSYQQRVAASQPTSLPRVLTSLPVGSLGGQGLTPWSAPVCCCR